MAITAKTAGTQENLSVHHGRLHVDLHALVY